MGSATIYYIFSLCQEQKEQIKTNLGTKFPGVKENVLGNSVSKRAFGFQVVNLRNFAAGRVTAPFLVYLSQNKGIELSFEGRNT